MSLPSQSGFYINNRIFVLLSLAHSRLGRSDYSGFGEIILRGFTLSVSWQIGGGGGEGGADWESFTSRQPGRVLLFIWRIWIHVTLLQCTIHTYSYVPELAYQDHNSIFCHVLLILYTISYLTELYSKLYLKRQYYEFLNRFCSSAPSWYTASLYRYSYNWPKKVWEKHTTSKI